MPRTLQPTLGPMEVIAVDQAQSTVDQARSTTVNTVDRERDWLALVPRALGKAGVSHKAAASDLEIDRGLLSAQLSGAPNKHLSWRRMWKLSPEFWAEIIPLICDFHGITINGTRQDAEDAAIGRLVREAVSRAVVPR